MYLIGSYSSSYTIIFEIITFYHLYSPGSYKETPLLINNAFCQDLDMGKEVRAVLCDIRKVFDRVRHAGLIHKLKAAGVQGELLK